MYVKKSLRRSEIYGITGRKSHGKDTFATHVIQAQERIVQARSKGQPKQGFVYTHFAESLKTMSGEIFGLTHDQMYDQNLKEAPLAVPVEMDLYLPQMRQATGLEAMAPAQKIGHSPREILQYFGTDYVRKTQDDYWIQHTLQFAFRHPRVLIPDTRFPNEAEAIRQAGGKIIKIVRMDVADSGDAHASETSIDQIEPDLLLMVRTGDLSLVTRVATLVAQGKFHSALKYDWRKASIAMRSYTAGATLEEASKLLGDHKSAYALHNLLDYYEVPKRKQSLRVPHVTIDGVTMKQCPACTAPRPLTLFNRSSKSWDGLAGICRECAAHRNKTMYQKYGTAHSLEHIFKLFERGAAQRGREFHLTFQDMQSLWEKQQGLCYYSAVKMTTTVSDPNKVSIDRLDSTQEYTPDNVVLCTSRINLMKRNMTLEEFLGVVLRVSVANFPQLHKTREEVLRTLQNL